MFKAPFFDFKLMTVKLNYIYIEFGESFAKETFSYDEHLES